MESLYYFFVIILAVLAVTDLIVGVSNDAVNFLNSAIGSRVGSRRLILIVASLGIILGSVFSSGMMDIAKSGIFNPAYFQFNEIMIIFMAVMLADIVLLDIYNTFGMPTSTTVSIIFELLGASVTVAALKIASQGQGIAELAKYINSAKALAIISAILISVAVSFTIGMIVQFIARILFSFNFKKRLRIIGPIWAGFAFVALFYYLFFKGLKGASFISSDFRSMAESNMNFLTILGTMAVLSILMYIIQFVFKTNVLKLVVLFGTFSLAMAFASNDLVNFIGVPIAGFEAFNLWRSSGLPPDGFSMGALAEPLPTSPVLLLVAGIIMTLTLWFSKKSRTVTETEVNLSRQDDGNERFAPNMLSRGVVRVGISIGNFFEFFVPKPIKAWISKNFEKKIPDSEKELDQPAFDLVRASVNLVVASVLIASATSLKLPLSTTYVSFMVAMGTSLSDQAWGRDSAVYRVAGVFNVIGGWFLTALFAFITSSVCAIVIFQLEIYGIVLLILAIIFLVGRTLLLHKKKAEQQRKIKEMDELAFSNTATKFIQDTRETVGESMREVIDAYDTILEGLVIEDETVIKKAKKEIKKFNARNKDVRSNIVRTVKLLSEAEAKDTRQYILVFDLEQDMVQCILLMATACFKHVDNHHKPIRGEQANQLKEVKQQVVRHMKLVSEVLATHDYARYREVADSKQLVFLTIDDFIEKQVSGVRNEKYSTRSTQLMLKIVLESKDLIAVTTRFIRLYKEIFEKQSTPGNLRGSEYRIR